MILYGNLKEHRDTIHALFAIGTPIWVKHFTIDTYFVPLTRAHFSAKWFHEWIFTLDKEEQVTQLFQINNLHTHKRMPETPYFANKQAAKEYRGQQSTPCYVAPGPEHRRFKK